MWAETGIVRGGEKIRKGEKAEQWEEQQQVDQGVGGMDGDHQPGRCLSESKAGDCSRPDHRLVGRIKCIVVSCIKTVQSLSMDKLSEEAKADKASRLVKSKHTYYRSVMSLLSRCTMESIAIQLRL